MIEIIRKPIKGKSIPIHHFPTNYQAVIFRLWEMVSCEKIAEVISAEVEQVKKAAEDMGLGEQKGTAKWKERGYISIIKAVWNLLPYEQILMLLDWDIERLGYVLKEDDFLGNKLSEKCDCEQVCFRELTEKEQERTKEIRDIMLKEIRPLDADGEAQPFDFFNSHYKPLVAETIREVVVDSNWALEVPEDDSAIKDFIEDFQKFASGYGVYFAEKSNRKIKIEMVAKTEDEEYREIEISEELILIQAGAPIGVLRALYDLEELVENAGTFSFEKRCYKKRTRVKTRFIYSFCSLYADVLDKDTEISFPDALLEGYGRRGINGIWIQGVLYKMAPYPFDEKMADGWEERLKRLDELTKRAARYGIKVYVYINEPRPRPLSFFEKRPDLKGMVRLRNPNFACLCSSHPETKRYLREALQTVCRHAPLLGGFLNITMSENQVFCSSTGRLISEERKCPVCGNRDDSVVTAEMITCMTEAIAEVSPEMKMFTFAWEWEHMLGDEGTASLVQLLPPNAIVLQVSETRIKFEREGVPGIVRDYSLSIVGPGEVAKRLWKQAKSRGLEVAAKVQINTSWECSSAPFLPVYNNVVQHMKNLIEEGVDHIMLSWTLGGYVSENLKIAASYFFEDEQGLEDSYESVLAGTYGSYADVVKKAVDHFCRGFAEYPFHMCNLYRGPSNAGAANLLYPEPTGMKATMTCFPYDDVIGWSGIHPEDAPEGPPFSPEILEIQYEKMCAEWKKGLDMLEGMPICEFYDMALYGYTLFKASYNQVCYYRLRDKGGNPEELQKILKSEKELALQAYQIMLRNSAVGYEASNHYYVTRSMLAEKVVECEYLLNGI